MMEAMAVNTAATALCLPENVIKNFLELIDSVEKHSILEYRTPYPHTPNAEVDLDALVDEYSRKL